MSDDIVNPEMRWTATTEFMRKAAEDNEKRRELEAAVERVRALHAGRVVSSGLRRVCWECAAPFPCPTLRALEETP